MVRELAPPVRAAQQIRKSRVEQICENVEYLIELNEAHQQTKTRVQRILDGGQGAIQELMGQTYASRNFDLPFANLMLNANTVLGGKLGKYPQAVVEPPEDTDTSISHAQTRARICDWLDSESKLHLRLPQAGRWVPGYGYTVFRLVEQKSRSGYKYPHVQLLDPYNTYPGPWGLDQQPHEVAFRYNIPYTLAHRQYPMIQSTVESYGGQRLMGGVVLNNQSDYTSQGGKEVTLYEYMDETGTYVAKPDSKQILSYEPNPIAPTTHFYTAKRYSFNQVAGALDQSIGLLAAMARVNILTIKAMEHAIGSEVNIFGNMQGNTYRQGPGQFNYFDYQTRVEPMRREIPFQVFNHRQGLEEDTRTMLRYPITEDAQAPMSFITGRGVDSLRGSISEEVNEYLLVFRDAIEEVDYRRLKWLHKTNPETEYDVEGLAKDAAYSQKFKPRVHINGRYLTQRPYGLMASLDDTNRLIGMLHLSQNMIVDRRTVRENTDLQNIDRIEERLNAQMADDAGRQIVTQMALQGDPNAAEALFSLLPSGEMKDLFMNVIVQARQAQEQQGQQAMTNGAPEDVNTLLSRLTNTGNPVLGSQTVSS